MTATTLATTLATLTGCSADNAPDTTVRANEAVTFGATIDSRNAPDNGPASDSRNASDSRTAPATRAITNGTFDDGDPILVHIYGTLKDFAYSTAHGGFVHNPTSSGANIDPTPPYWQGGDTQTDALAYGPATSIVRNSQDEYTLQTRVAADQRGDDAYTGGDYVYTAQALQRQSPALTFRHGMARVVIRLRPGGSLTDEEVAGTTLMLGNDNLLTTADIHPQTGALTAHAPTATTPGGLQPQTVTPPPLRHHPRGLRRGLRGLASAAGRERETPHQRPLLGQGVGLCGGERQCAEGRARIHLQRDRGGNPPRSDGDPRRRALAGRHPDHDD